MKTMRPLFALIRVRLVTAPFFYAEVEVPNRHVFSIMRVYDASSSWNGHHSQSQEKFLKLSCGDLENA